MSGIPADIPRIGELSTGSIGAGSHDAGQGPGVKPCMLDLPSTPPAQAVKKR